ncbi:Mfa1 family fimbria major subunit [Bacteroides gallinarum]|uniref:Mfa1 family fimbria major subunit n=2 Tax=Bacteroides gallinarum TaxID=376806 RepID=UPI0003A593DC|nr:Mfa1 family fimbria major subunit [Bacteroides gallinarum]
MKIFSKLLIGTLLILTGAACNDELPTGNPGGTEISDPVYIEFKVEMRAGGLSTRGATADPDDDGYVTSEDGKEIGKSRENQIQEILLLFADPKGQYIHSGAYPIEQEPANAYTISMPLEQLESYDQEGDIQVYLFCNPTEELKSAASGLTAGNTLSAFLDGAYTLSDEESEESRAWKDDSFFMSNAVPHAVHFPGSWSDYRNESTPWKLGTIRVERSVARFDYREKMKDNIYRVYDKTDGSTTYDRNPDVYIQLTDIALVNMSRSFYYWRRVSNAADGMSDPVISGTETHTNYVVDTDAARKKDYTKEGWKDKTDYFFYNLETPADRVFTRISDIAGNEEDEDTSWNDEQKHNGYHIWRYATENTIPDANRQRNGITTAILFKAVIRATEGCALEGQLDAGEAVYVFKNKLYGDWNAVKEAATSGNSKKLKKAYDAVESGTSPEEAGFTVFCPADDGNYYTYYYYWSRHNDNGQDTVSGSMEFAVVRNNVYKLQVDALYGFGYPEGTYPDPDTPDEQEPDDDDDDPDDPDPEPDPDPDPEPEPGPTTVQLKLTVKVLPWVMREYTITIK